MQIREYSTTLFPYIVRVLFRQFVIMLLGILWNFATSPNASDTWNLWGEWEIKPRSPILQVEYPKLGKNLREYVYIFIDDWHMMNYWLKIHVHVHSTLYVYIMHCMYICTLYVYIYIYTYIQLTYLYIYLYNIYIFIYLYIHVYTGTCIFNQWFIISQSSILLTGVDNSFPKITCGLFHIS